MRMNRRSQWGVVAGVIWGVVIGAWLCRWAEATEPKVPRDISPRLLAELRPYSPQGRRVALTHAGTWKLSQGNSTVLWYQKKVRMQQATVVSVPLFRGWQESFVPGAPNGSELRRWDVHRVLRQQESPHFAVFAAGRHWQPELQFFADSLFVSPPKEVGGMTQSVAGTPFGGTLIVAQGARSIGSQKFQRTVFTQAVCDNQDNSYLIALVQGLHGADPMKGHGNPERNSVEGHTIIDFGHDQPVVLRRTWLWEPYAAENW